ncbi:xanthine dehydrogenase family protein subunit M, partial [Amycolatopsis sp. NPDC059027]
VCDWQSYCLALCPAAVARHTPDSRVVDARVAAGGVATVPWRLPEVEAALRGAPATLASFEAAAALAAEGAKPLAMNGFKVSLLKRTVIRALLELAEGSH